MDIQTKNILSGAGTGASLGSSLGPWGTAAGIVAGGILGGALGPDEQNPVLPPMVDPTQQKLLDDLYAKKRSIEMGTSTEFQTGREILARSEATALSNVAMITGGDVASAVSAAERIMEAGGENTAKLVGQASQMATPYMSMIQEATDKMAQRRLSLGMIQYNQGMAENAMMEQTANDNLSAVLSSSSLLDSLKGLGGAVIKSFKGGVVTPQTPLKTPSVTEMTAFNIGLGGMANPTLDLLYK